MCQKERRIPGAEMSYRPDQLEANNYPIHLHFHKCTLQRTLTLKKCHVFQKTLNKCLLKKHLIKITYIINYTRHAMHDPVQDVTIETITHYSMYQIVFFYMTLHFT